MWVKKTQYNFGSETFWSVEHSAVYQTLGHINWISLELIPNYLISQIEFHKPFKILPAFQTLASNIVTLFGFCFHLNFFVKSNDESSLIDFWKTLFILIEMAMKCLFFLFFLVVIMIKCLLFCQALFKGWASSLPDAGIQPQRRLSCLHRRESVR